MSKRSPLATPRPPSVRHPYACWSAYAPSSWAPYGTGVVGMTKAPDRARLSNGVTGLAEDEEALS